ncbi:MAG: hypothetical protein SCM11_02675 [Bacillota bacterium]|nr:hypothetical protein [Bacillota bacterium]
MVPQIDEDKIGQGKDDGQHDFAAFTSFNRINLHAWSIWILMHVIHEILISTALSAVVVDFVLIFTLTWAITDLTHQTDITAIKGALIDESVQGAFTANQLVGGCGKNMVQRLALPHRRRDNVIEPFQLIVVIGAARPAVR